MYHVEQAAGPADGYDTVDAFLDAVCAALAEERSQQSEHQRVAHGHWKRLSWLRDHTAHGSVEVSPPDIPP